MIEEQMMKRLFSRQGQVVRWSIVGLWVFLCVQESCALERFSFHPWMVYSEEVTDLDLSGDTIQPRKVTPEENLSLRIRRIERAVTSSWAGIEQASRDPGVMVDGDTTSAYTVFTSTRWTPGTVPSGTLMLDLGGWFGVNRVRLVPREKEGWISLSGQVYEEVIVGVNDGNPENVDGRGRPILTPVWSGRQTASAAVDVSFSPHNARYAGVYLNAAGVSGISIAELEVYGTGYVGRSRYLSKVVDMGRRVTLGEIYCTVKQPEGTKVEIRTRSGTDDDPNVYWRLVGKDETSMLSEATGEPLTKEEYEMLPSREQMGITYDRKRWSFWSAPYPLGDGKEGVPIASPSPRRYVQMDVAFRNPYWIAGEVEDIAFEYSYPPAAHKLVAEVWPLEVEPAESVTFTYALKAFIEDDDTGFDVLEILTPAIPEVIRSVKIDRAEVPCDAEILPDPPGMRLHIPLITVDFQFVEVTSDCRVMRYGDAFVGRAWREGRDQVPQLAIPGNAIDTLPGDDVSVRIGLRHPVIKSLVATPDPFTPNGDGINDHVAIRYTLLHLTRPDPVALEIFGLAGRKVRTVYSGKERSGAYEHMWNGRDDAGAMVMPGVYVCRLTVHSDGGLLKRTTTVSVVY